MISHTGKTQVCIAVGYDSRITSPAFCEAVVKGITSTGHDAVVTGLSTTPSMFTLLKDEKAMAQQYCHGSIMITASHLPFNRNGLKFFSHNGCLEGSDVKELLELAANYRFAEPTKTGKITSIHYLNDYAANLVEKVRVATGEETPLQGKKIIVDAGNGAGGFFVDKVLMPLGADTQGSQFSTPTALSLTISLTPKMRRQSIPFARRLKTFKPISVSSLTLTSTKQVLLITRARR